MTLLVWSKFLVVWAPTLYYSGIPIDAITASANANDSSSQIHRYKAYQSLVGSIGWLSSTTRPDLMPVHSFLASSSNKPLAGHMKAVLYTVHYIHSTHDYGILFTSDEDSLMHSFAHFPPLMDVKAYTNVVPPIVNWESHPPFPSIATLAGVHQ
jgi:hypothetical protein